MGICASCLGLNRRASSSDPSDTSQLLGDQYQTHYGSLHASAPHSGPQLDPEEIRRQRDVLERICAQTSDKLIDVSQSAYTEERSKLINEYPRLFAERFSSHKSDQPTSSRSRPSSAGSAGPVDETTWLASAIGEGGQEEGHWDRVEPVSGALTLQFDDALGGGSRR